MGFGEGGDLGDGDDAGGVEAGLGGGDAGGDHAGAEDLDSQGDDAGGDDAGLSGDDAVGDDGSGHEVEVGVPAFKRMKDDLPTSIEGVDISEQIFNEEGDDAAHAPYHKLTVQCPCSRSTHLAGYPCAKSRNLAEFSTRHFGRIEAIGFLGKWLSKAPDFESREAHMKYRPTVPEIEGYLLTNDLL
jgi:hypothetical protein